MKTKEYVQPQMRIYEISTMQILASSETLSAGKSEEGNAPKPNKSTIWGD